MPEVQPESEPQIQRVAGGWRFDHSYSRLPKALFERVMPTAVRKPGLLLFNSTLAAELGLGGDELARPESAETFAGNRPPENSLPLAQAYAGHQFGHLTMLGDGRALLLGEHLAQDGRRFDIQLKGSGPTPFSRGGDGRAGVGPMLREYVISEAMHALGIPTTRSLAVATTGEKVHREQPLDGAVLTRVAASHLRVGTFEFAAALRDPVLLQELADYTLARHFPAAATAAQPYLALLESVVERQAALLARWMWVGFVHGVMNTDNMALSGETLDYGPCAFLDAYHPDTVFSSIDRQGRYAYGRQPKIAQWNLSRFAACLLPLLHRDAGEAIAAAQAAIDSFADRFEKHWLAGARAKLGLITSEEGDRALVADLLARMEERRSDFTNTFRDLSFARLPGADPAFAPEFDAWLARLDRQGEPREKLLEGMRAHNPARIPRNHRVEEALQAATEAGDLGPLRRLVEALADPYDHHRNHDELEEPAPPGSPPYRTFCGT